MLSPALSTLLDDARAEAKRVGHAAATPLHLAAALARRDPDAFEAAFGPGASARLRNQLLRSTPAGTDEETIALLQSVGSDDTAAVIAALKKLGLVESDGDGQQSRGNSQTSTDSRFQHAEAPHSAASPRAQPASPRAQPAASGRLLEPVPPDPAITGFDGLLDELVSLLSMRAPATPLVKGPAGCGKSSVVVALATRLGDGHYSGPLAGSILTRIDTSTVLSEEPIAALDRALDAQQTGEIVAVDDLESLLSLGSAATILPMLMRLRGAATDPTRRIVLVVDDAYTTRLEGIDQELTTLTTQIEVPALAIEQLWEIARGQATELAAHHHVELSDAVVRMAASPRASADRRAHPGLLIDRLDRACARAAMRADKHVQDDDLALAGDPEVAPLDAVALVEALRGRVRGQDAALQPVGARLALTRAQLDLRPARPDGVFLFVGPTGVGKTELARALCEQLFGDEERLVRLDMSEYAEPWALSRLIGPQPGYVGYTEPESWLTTRIRKQPHTVLLLDEIEKAHPTVWNAFLQVFDAGRLSDARGNVANFGHVVIAMTSNLGGTAFAAAPVGFAPPLDDAALTERDHQRVLDAVKEAMSPELVNRLDEIVVFAPLSSDAIEEIARLELERMRQRLIERGYILTIGEEVVRLVATSGFDPAYGARHLQRNIERLLLEPLASVTERDVVAEVIDGRVSWRARSRTKPRGGA